MSHPPRQKLTNCIPAHTADDEALHIAEQSYLRGWSHSAYLRHLIREDMRRLATQDQLMQAAGWYATERKERKERRKRK